MTTRSQTITTAVLVSVAVGLGAYLLIDRGNPTSAELETRKSNLLKVFRREEISELQLEVGGDKARIVRAVSPDATESDYRLFLGSSPDSSKAEPADQPAVDRLIQALEFASPVRSVDPATDKAGLGFEHPRAILSVRMGSVSWRIELGAEAGTPTGSAYASVPGQGTYVVARDFVADLLRPVDSYRSRIVLPYVASELAAIRLDGAGGARNLLKAPWGGFRIDTGGGQGPRVHRVVYDQLLTAFAALRVERFVSPAAAEDALRAAKQQGKSVSLVAEPVDKARPIARVEIGGECPAAAAPRVDAAAPDASLPEAGGLVVVIRREPQPMSACVPASAMEGLRTSSDQFADKRLLDLRPDDVEELKIQRAERVLELVRKGSGWKMRHPEERDVTGADAKGFVEGLTKLEGELVSPADPKALGLEPAKGTLVVIQPASGSQEHPQQKLELGDEQGGYSYVRRVQDGVVLRIAGNQAHQIEPVATYLRSSALLDLSADRIRKVSITWGQGDKQIIARTPSGFKFEAPNGYVVDGSLSADLFDSLAKLSAERWVADRDDGSYGFAKPAAVAQVEGVGDGGTKSWRLLIGARIGDGVYGRWEPDTGVFVLPVGVQDQLTTYVIDRSMFMIDPSEVRDMTLSAGGKKAVIVGRAGGTWANDPDAGIALAEGSVERIQSAFLEMRAEAALHLGDAQESEGFAKPLLEVVVHRIPGHEERSKDIRIAIGKGDAWRTMSVYYARREGVAATYVIGAARVKPVLKAMGVE
ncbi:MAG: DUF4340 domain-containing protein [Deltaproteobacteria bacterium]|nr:DUF4340 domain-containing protein [Deltaproteobacteria bacterium]